MIKKQTLQIEINFIENKITEIFLKAFVSEKNDISNRK